MARVDVNSLMQQAYHSANNRLNIQHAIAKTPAAAPLPDIGAAGVQAVQAAGSENKLLTINDMLAKVLQQNEALNVRAAQIGAAMQGAANKATGGAK